MGYKKMLNFLHIEHLLLNQKFVESRLSNF